MLSNKYESTIDWLFQQFPSYQLIGDKAYKPTLDNIKKLVEKLGHPEKNLRFIHLAGTNGKGSTSSMLASILQESGERVGLFTSPHLLDFRERIRVNGGMISENAVVDFVDKIKVLHLDFEPSFFEISFTMALEHFKNENCTICVIETGMGGRLDATNIVLPILSIITSISKDHEQHLGKHLDQIASEKAGIMKEGIPCILAEQKHKEAKNTIIQKAKDRKIELFLAEKEITDDILFDFQLPLLGTYQYSNLRTVLTALQLLSKDFPHAKEFIQLGLKNVQNNTGLTGRLQVMQWKPMIIFDVSHNEDGVIETLTSIRPYVKGGKLIILYAAASDKDVRKIIQLFPLDAKLNFTQFKSDRKMPVEQLRSIGKEMNRNAVVHPDAKAGLQQLKSDAKENDVVLVIGSFFLVAELLR